MKAVHFKSTGTVLDRILAQVQIRLIEDQKKKSMEDLRRQLVYQPKNFRDRLQKPSTRFFSVIAEIKYFSPSLAQMGQSLNEGRLEKWPPTRVAESYLRAEATAISILTERDFFRGSLSYLAQVRQAFPDSYLLMKDFILSPYQIMQGRVAGADSILLIMAALEEGQASELLLCAKEQGVCPLVEVHNESELEMALKIGADLIGINNRNLHTLEISIQTSKDLVGLIPDGVAKVSESGLNSADALAELSSVGFDAFLMGHHLMNAEDPGVELSQLVEKRNSLEN